MLKPPESNSPENLRRLLTLILTDPETFVQCAEGRQPAWEGAPGVSCEACGHNTVSLARTWKLIDHACESCGHRWVAWKDAEAKAQWDKAWDPTEPPTTKYTPIAERLNELLQASDDSPASKSDVAVAETADTILPANPKYAAVWTLIVDVLKKELGMHRRKMMADAIIEALASSMDINVIVSTEAPKPDLTPMTSALHAACVGPNDQTRTRFLGKVGEWDIWRTMSGVECRGSFSAFGWTLNQLRLYATENGFLDTGPRSLAAQILMLLGDEGGAGEARWYQPTGTLSYLGAFGDWDIWSNRVGVTCVSTGYKLLYWPVSSLHNPTPNHADLARHTLKLIADAGSRGYALNGAAGPG